jgi:urease accessory protein
VTCSSTLERVGRDGTLGLQVERRGDRSVVTACRSTLPLQVLAPVALEDPAAVVSVLNPTGGLVGGDRLSIDVVVGPGAHACLTTPSATKVYRTNGPPAEQLVTLRLEAGATVEYVPDHTIPFAGAAFRQAIRVELGAGARLILVDAFAAGRIARGEAWRFSLLESALVVREHRGWRLRDRVCLRGCPDWTGLGFTEDYPYFGTVVVLADGGPNGFGAHGDRLAARRDVSLGGGALAGGDWIGRILARDAPALTQAVEEIWTLARRTVLGAGPLGLRKL